MLWYTARKIIWFIWNVLYIYIHAYIGRKTVILHLLTAGYILLYNFVEKGSSLYPFEMPLAAQKNETLPKPIILWCLKLYIFVNFISFSLFICRLAEERLPWHAIFYCMLVFIIEGGININKIFKFSHHLEINCDTKCMEMLILKFF